MDKTNDIFFALLRSAIKNENEEISLADVDYEALFSLAKFHDLAHIVYYELKKRDSLPEDETGKKFKDQYDIAIYRHIRRTTAITEVRKILENACIPFILLKGVVLMDLYPEQWMRTSADVDILVQKNDFQKAIDVFKENGMVLYVGTEHDVSFNTKDKYHIELHHTLIEDDRFPAANKYISRVWEYSKSKGNSAERILYDDMFYFYHIVHMAKHFKGGGCGIRSILDLWLLDHCIDFERDKREVILQETGLKTFAEKAESLSEKWFSKTETSNLSSDFEEYIVNGGIYGTSERVITIRKNKEKNRFVYYFKRIFQPYSQLKHTYPILQRLPFLLPFCWVARWFKLLNPKKRKQAVNEIKIESSVSNEESDRMVSLMKELEIW